MTRPLEDLLPNVNDPRMVEAFAVQIARAAILSNGRCCEGLIENGQLGCTCWIQIYDVDQADPVQGVPTVMARPCGDCAYRKNSPERQGKAHVRGDGQFLDDIVADGEPFWCHDGMRQVIALVHPTGARIELPRDVAYAPPIEHGRPFRADGSIGSLCAGWSARRLKHVLASPELQETP